MNQGLCCIRLGLLCTRLGLWYTRLGLWCSGHLAGGEGMGSRVLAGVLGSPGCGYRVIDLTLAVSRRSLRMRIGLLCIRLGLWGSLPGLWCVRCLEGGDGRGRREIAGVLGGSGCGSQSAILIPPVPRHALPLYLRLWSPRMGLWCIRKLLWGWWAGLDYGGAVRSALRSRTGEFSSSLNSQSSFILPWSGCEGVVKAEYAFCCCARQLAILGELRRRDSPEIEGSLSLVLRHGRVHRCWLPWSKSRPGFWGRWQRAKGLHHFGPRFFPCRD